jgi:hypothetical protein
VVAGAFRQIVPDYLFREVSTRHAEVGERAGDAIQQKLAVEDRAIINSSIH